MNSGYTAMVFQSPIDGVKRARALYLCQLKGLSLQKVAEICTSESHETSIVGG